MVDKILKVSETYWLIDSYDGSGMCRNEEIKKEDYSKLEMMIGEKTGLKLINAGKWLRTLIDNFHTHTFEYESPGEKNPAKLDLTESCYTSPEITITAEIKNPQNIVQADDNLTKILDAAITSIKELGKSTGAVRKA